MVAGAGKALRKEDEGCRWGRVCQVQQEAGEKRIPGKGSTVRLAEGEKASVRK